MTAINVQFSGATKTAIVSYFSTPQNSSVWENTGTVDTADSEWAAYYNSLPEMMKTGLPVPE